MRAHNNSTKWYPLFHLSVTHNKIDDVSTTHAPTSSTQIFFKIMSAVEISEISTALLINILLCIAFLNQRKLRSKPAYRFFINLQVAHFILLMSNIIQKCHKKYSAIHIYVNNGLLMALFTSLFLTTMDRLITIKYPSKYAQIRLTQINAIICCSWLPGIMFVFGSILSRVPQNIMTVINIILIGFASIVLVLSNCIIHAIARRRWLVINSRAVHPSSSDLNSEKKRLKSTYVCHAIVISFLVFWLPYFVHDISLLQNKHHSLNHKWTACVEILSIANAILNPICFVLFRKDAKEELRRLLKRIRSKSSNMNESKIRTSSEVNCMRVSIKLDKDQIDKSNLKIEKINTKKESQDEQTAKVESSSDNTGPIVSTNSESSNVPKTDQNENLTESSVHLKAEVAVNDVNIGISELEEMKKVEDCS